MSAVKSTVLTSTFPAQFNASQLNPAKNLTRFSCSPESELSVHLNYQENIKMKLEEVSYWILDRGLSDPG